MPTGDEAIDAAFSSSIAGAPPASSTGDEAIDTAFSKTSSEKVSPDEVVRRLVANKVTSGLAAIPAGFRSIYDITTGKSVAETDKRYQEFIREHSYQPPDATSQALSAVYGKAASSAANPLTWPGRVADVMAGDSAAPPPGLKGASNLPTTGGNPDLAPILSGVLQFGAGAAPAVMGLRGPPPISAQQVVDRAVANSPQSMGAAAAAPNVAATTPELQQAIVRKAQQTGGTVNPEALSRHLEANSLPVPMQLTAGQALQDPVTLSGELNSRGAQPGLAARFNEQNGQLVQNLQAIRDRVGPDVFSTNAVEHADTLIKAYQDKGAAADAVTNTDYQALRDAAGGNFPVSAPKLLQNANSALHKQLLFDDAPKSVMTTLGRLADSDNMTYENFESLRTNLARIMRTSTNGNERAAAGIIREQMEELPLQPGSAQLKPLADKARASARAQFQALEADPAYKAAVTESVPPDRFIQKFVIGAPRDDVALMRENLAHDETATQTMGVATLDHLRRQAGIDDMGNGNFSQAGFNKHLQALSPKMPSLLDPQTNEQLQTLGNVARYTQFQPRGSFVNNSNTLVGALASHAADLAEGAGNLAGGRIIPVGSLVRGVLQKNAAAKAAQKSLEPGAGLERLSDVGRP